MQNQFTCEIYTVNEIVAAAWYGIVSIQYRTAAYTCKALYDTRE
jgi:hypothetical protein